MAGADGATAARGPLFRCGARGPGNIGRVSNGQLKAMQHALP